MFPDRKAVSNLTIWFPIPVLFLFSEGRQGEALPSGFRAASCRRARHDLSRLIPGTMTCAIQR
ncbi:hypothetical protein CHELA20_52034 [Hyphomicrobiales bacterium]|nr:hypothetical protein CHELA41_22890 [Hyphomicrobiales bacterium]CAH1680197.1 hypothetical protein CHELA20_52034 [Hyphomicrobiales bacterium]